MFLYNLVELEVFIKVVGTSLDIFGNIWMSLGNRRKSSDVAVTFSEIPVMMRQKSNAFDWDKVGGQVYMYCIPVNVGIQQELTVKKCTCTCKLFSFPNMVLIIITLGKLNILEAVNMICMFQLLMDF